MSVCVHTLQFMCTYFGGGITSGYLWIIWLFEGFSGSNLILLSTFNIQIIEMWQLIWLIMVNFKGLYKN